MLICFPAAAAAFILGTGFGLSTKTNEELPRLPFPPALTACALGHDVC